MIRYFFAISIQLQKFKVNIFLMSRSYSYTNATDQNAV